MKLSTEAIKTLVFSLVVAFAGHVIAAPTWFSGTALNNELSAYNAEWTTNVVGDVTVTGDVLEIDLPTNAVVKLIPTPDESKSKKKTIVTVSEAVFTPTSVGDIDNSVVQDSQTALTVAYDNSSTNYYAYITNAWIKLEGTAPTADPVNVTVVLDYSVSTQTNVSFKIGTDPFLHGAGNVDKFPIAASARALSRIDLAGYGKLHSITTAVETVEITPQSVTYGADFTNVTVTAEVSSTAAETSYYLTWGNGNRVPSTSASGSVVTFANVPIASPSSPYQEANYVITAEVGGSPIYVTEPVSTPIADVKNWIDERAGTTATAEAGGSWNPALSVSYDDNDIATITGEKTFKATNCSTGDLVRITFSNIVYAEVSDLTVDTPVGTQGAFALSDNGGSTTNFFVLRKPADTYEWVEATCADVEANTNISYTVEMSFNYASNTYSVAVRDTAGHSGVLQVGGQSEFAICADKTNVTDFVFKGNGTLKSITGEECNGYMVQDAAGKYWLTILQAVDNGTGPFTILRATDTNAKYRGWKFDNSDGVWKLVKAAVGMFFFAF